MSVLLEKYLASSTHNWGDYRRLHKKQNPGAKIYKVKKKKEGNWETKTRMYWKVDDKIKYKNKGELCVN